jgi:topoisomerase-4 subunit A
VNGVVVLDTMGRAYTLRGADVPGGRGDGVPVTTLVDLQPGAHVAHAICGEPAQKYLVAGTGGYGFVASLEDMVARQRAGKAFMTLAPGEEPLAPVPLTAGLDHVAALSSRGRLLVFPLAEMREVPRGRGVIVIGLDRGETLAAIGLATAAKVVLQGTNRLGRSVSVAIEGEDLAKHLLHRARKGSLAAPKLKATGLARET